MCLTAGHLRCDGTLTVCIKVSCVISVRCAVHIPLLCPCVTI